MIPIQFDLFKSREEAEVDCLRRTLDRVRKGTYAEINTLRKRIVELEEKQAIIERNICKTK
jgi:uncharacterized protein Yka (UPF0111/DUF47 family)